MFQNHKLSSFIILVLLFLIPIFFIPGSVVSIAVAKSTLLVFAVVVSLLAFLVEVWREGRLEIAWHLFIPVSILLVLVYLLSAFLATPSSLSLLGYNFEAGTFGFMLLATALMLLVSIVFAESERTLKALTAIFGSFLLVALFVAIKVLFGLQAGTDVLVWGNFFGNMGNPIGNWTDLGIAFGLLSVLAALSIGMIQMRVLPRILVYIVFVLGVCLLVIINFKVALILTLGASIFLLFYFWKLDNNLSSNGFSWKPTVLPIILAVISIIFIINPTVSATKGRLGDVVSSAFRIQNTDVRPSLSATLTVSKGVLSENGFLGSGPNTFGRDWLVHKPAEVNTTPFWAVAFPFGAGFVPTQVASIGIVGTVLWLAFFITILIITIKALIRLPESSSERVALIATLVSSLFLWVASFLYTPSVTLLFIAFIISGLMIATSRNSGIISSRVFNIKALPQMRYVSAILLVVIALGAIYLGSIGWHKTLSAYHFKKAVDLSNTTSVPTADIESELNKAIEASPTDIYYIGLSRIYFAKAQAAASATTGAPEDNRALFEDSLRKSIEAARSAVSINPSSYENWTALGLIYSALSAEPLKVTSAYENAALAYSEANKRNPNNPELALLSARLELNHGNKEAARSFLRNAISLKEDYADAYLALAQLEIQDGNTREAISSAEKLALLVPNNPGLYFELGLLKYSNKDYQGATDTFAKALALVPDYANAQYYMGLSLIELKRIDEARSQFEALLVTNPDSAEVKTALQSLDKKR